MSLAILYYVLVIVMFVGVFSFGRRCNDFWLFEQFPPKIEGEGQGKNKGFKGHAHEKFMGAFRNKNNRILF